MIKCVHKKYSPVRGVCVSRLIENWFVDKIGPVPIILYQSGIIKHNCEIYYLGFQAGWHQLQS